MNSILQSLFLLLAKAADRELARQLQFVRLENQLLRKRLPRRLGVTASERRLLIKVGKPLGRVLNDLLSIVSPRTFARWLARRQTSRRQTPRRAVCRGRPPTTKDGRALVIRLADENAWGYTRIFGELKKLGVTGISRSTVANILRQEGFDPGPRRGAGSWHDFIRRHTQTLWACDFFSKKICTLSGLLPCFVLFFIHLGTRRVHVAGVTTNPDAAWMAERAGEVRRFFAAQPHPARYLIRDLDSKFTREFDAILSAAQTKVIKVGPLAPNLNAHAERFVLTVQSECLDHFVVFGEAHLRYLLSEFLEHYHEERPHQGRGNQPLTGVAAPTDCRPPSRPEVGCRKRLGGLLRHYSRRVA
jgi:putative transposase